MNAQKPEPTLFEVGHVEIVEVERDVHGKDRCITIWVAGRHIYTLGLSTEEAAKLIAALGGVMLSGEAEVKR